MSSSSKRSPPLLVYRGDSRHPDEIFKQGFQAKGGADGDDSVLAHVVGGSENLRKTGLISTSQSLRIPPIFMQPVVKDNKFDTKRAKDGKEYTKRSAWVYHIKPSSDLKMVYVPDELKGSNLKPLYDYQQEWAVRGPIPGKNIKGAQRVEGYVYRQDLLDGRGPFVISSPEFGDIFHEWVPNPNYAY